MLDFSIGLNNTLYLSDLEKSPLWRKVIEIALDKNNYTKDPFSFEMLLIFFILDWSKTMNYDHFGRPSIFTKLIRQVKENAHLDLKANLEDDAKGNSM